MRNQWLQDFGTSPVAQAQISSKQRVAGSEGSRSNLPAMKIHDIEKVTKEIFGGDHLLAIDALARIKGLLGKL